MKQKIKPILTGILIGIVAFPTITLGGTFVSSLIQGKTVEEAVQILAQQIDSLIGRVEVVEREQEKQKLWQEKVMVCEEYQKLFDTTPRQTQNQNGRITDPILQVEAFIEYAQNALENYGWSTTDQLYLNTKGDLEKAIQQKEPLRIAKEKCENLTSQYNELYGTSE